MKFDKSDIQNYLELSKSSPYQFNSKNIQFSMFFEADNSKYVLYGLTACKEYPLDDIQAFLHKRELNGEHLVPDNFCVLVKHHSFNPEFIFSTIWNFEDNLKIPRSEFIICEEYKTVACIFNKKWITMPGTLSFYLAIIRAAMENEKSFSIHVSEEELDMSFRDSKIFYHSKYKKFLEKFKEDKLGEPKENFKKSGANIHAHGIQYLLNSRLFF